MDRKLILEEPYIDDECEQLFLLEVIIDKVDIRSEGLLGAIETKEEVQVEEEAKPEEDEDEDEDEDEARRRREEERRRKKKKKKTRPLKVKVNFFHFPSIEIDEWDFTVEKEERAFELDMLKAGEGNSEEEELLADEEDMTLEEFREMRARRKQEIAEEIANSVPPGDKFCSGKSCLFPMIPLDLVNVIKKTPLEVQVHRMGDDEQGQRLIGKTNLTLGENFIEAIALASSPTILPVSAFIDAPCEVKNVFDETTAIVNFYLKLSCFGNTIFTQFSLKEGNDDYLFKTDNEQERLSVNLIKKNEKSQIVDYLPKLCPMFTKAEDFIIGVNLNLTNDYDKKLKNPIPWHKKDYEPPLFNICLPKKLGKLPEINYRRKISMEQQLLEQVIPGFGRQIGDPNFVERLPNMPRECEHIICDDDDDKKEINIKDLTVFADGSKIGMKLPSQYGATWSPFKFPLHRSELFLPLEEIKMMKQTANDETTFYKYYLRTQIANITVEKAVCKNKIIPSYSTCKTCENVMKDSTSQRECSVTTQCENNSNQCKRFLEIVDEILIHRMAPIKSKSFNKKFKYFNNSKNLIKWKNSENNIYYDNIEIIMKNINEVIKNGKFYDHENQEKTRNYDANNINYKKYLMKNNYKKKYRTIFMKKNKLKYLYIERNHLHCRKKEKFVNKDENNTGNSPNSENVSSETSSKERKKLNPKSTNGKVANRYRNMIEIRNKKPYLGCRGCSIVWCQELGCEERSKFKYVYTEGNYPLNLFGHKHCIPEMSKPLSERGEFWLVITP